MASSMASTESPTDLYDRLEPMVQKIAELLKACAFDDSGIIMYERCEDLKIGGLMRTKIQDKMSRIKDEVGMSISISGACRLRLAWQLHLEETQ